MTPTILTRESCRSFIATHLFEPRLPAKKDTKQRDVGSIGIELEAFPYISDPFCEKGIKPVPFHGEGVSLMNTLVTVSEKHGGVPKYWIPGVQDHSYTSQVERIQFPDGDSFLFEPGGQVEISTAPCDTLNELQDHLASRQNILNEVTQVSHIQFLQSGTNPWFDVDEIGNQLHKPRYHALENYFDSIGPYGKKMMLQTCALHINLDLGQDHTMRVKRIIAANLLVPFVTALFANSSITEGKVNGHKTYRSFLWQHLDSTRTGILAIDKLSRTMHQDDLVDAYLEFALNAPIIFIPELGSRVFPKQYTFEYWLENAIEGIRPTISHFENHITLLFPEVRLKGYLEIRSVDAPPRGFEMIPVFFYAGLLYSNRYLDKVLEMLMPLSSRLAMLLADATLGLASDEIYTVSKNLMHLAIEGFSGLPDDFKSDHHTHQLISFFETFTLHRTTFADESPEKFIFNKTSIS